MLFGMRRVGKLTSRVLSTINARTVSKNTHRGLSEAVDRKFKLGRRRNTQFTETVNFVLSI
jgi:hypothetical protein